MGKNRSKIKICKSWCGKKRIFNPRAHKENWNSILLRASQIIELFLASKKKAGEIIHEFNLFDFWENIFKNIAFTNRSFESKINALTRINNNKKKSF